jgi:hypothetical protein
MVEPYEKYVRWYLRFKGYFAIENFVIHEPVGGVIPQGGEFDVMAVRFPFSREEAGFKLENDPKLGLSSLKDHIDFVIAEVGGGKRKELNKVWQPPDDGGIKAKRVAYALKWSGFFSDDAVTQRVAKEFQCNCQCRYDRFNCRVIVFAQEHKSSLQNRGIPQISFREISEWIVGVRSSCYAKRGLGVRSCHNQWDPLILQIWKIADPMSTVGQTDKVRRILDLLEEEWKACKSQDAVART